MPKKYQPPREEDRDLPAKIVRGAVAAVPGGGIIAELLSDPLQERRDQWADTVAYSPKNAPTAAATKVRATCTTTSCHW
jgi:hypothetical protein